MTVSLINLMLQDILVHMKLPKKHASIKVETSTGKPAAPQKEELMHYAHEH